VVRIYSIATVDVPAKPIWHHKSMIALFQIALQMLTHLLALTALAFRQRRAYGRRDLGPAPSNCPLQRAGNQAAPN
jgi:hypothetical protein